MSKDLPKEMGMHICKQRIKIKEKERVKTDMYDYEIQEYKNNLWLVFTVRLYNRFINYKHMVAPRISFVYSVNCEKSVPDDYNLNQIKLLSTTMWQ